jgi:CRISPR associated protein Cas1.
MLKIAYKDNPDNVTLRAIEDIAIILIDDHSASLTTPLISKLAEQNVAVVFCNEKHMPSSMLMNLNANTLQEKYFRLQLDASQPLKKQIVEKCRGGKNQEPGSSPQVPWKKTRQAPEIRHRSP